MTKKTIRLATLSMVAVLLFFNFTISALAASVYGSDSGTVSMNEYTLNYSWETTYEKADSGQSGDNNGGSGGVSLSGTAFTIKAKSSYYKATAWNNWTQDIVYNYTTKLTITNGGDYGCTITYSTTGDMGTVTGAKKVLAKGESITFTLATTTASDSTTAQNLSGTVTITAIEVANSNINIGFASFPNGSYTYKIGENETPVAPGDDTVTAEVAANSTVTLTAGDAAEGYSFYGWMADGSLLSTASSYDYSVSVATNIYPAFIPSDMGTAGAPFKVGSNTYMFWHLAFEAAVASGNPVLVNQNTTLPTSIEDNGLIAGHKYSDYISESNGIVTYIVASGTKLLVPYGSGDTSGSFGGSPANYISEAAACTLYDNNGTPSITARNFAYRTLTVPSGTKIFCDGAINVNGQRQETGQPYIGVSVGGYGKLVLNGDGEEQLTVRSGGALYCYGYITGNGKVNVLSGGEVRELMQICDWNGGGNALKWYGAANTNTLFMISQYYIQNIETTLQINSGAIAYAEVVIHGSDETIPRSVPYIGTSTGLFQLGSNSYIVRTYDTASDRVEYTLYGSAGLGSISISFDYGFTYTLDSSKYVMPINGNMTLRIADGATMTFDQRVALLPGSELIIDKGGSLNLGGMMYVMDVKDFTKSHFFTRTDMTLNSGSAWTKDANGNYPGKSPSFNALPYVATLNSVSPRTYKLLRGSVTSNGNTSQKYYMDARPISTSAKLEVNGTLNVSGQLLTTCQNGSTANKAIVGTGVINYSSTPAITHLKGGFKDNVADITTTYGLANIAGVGTLQPLAKATYYGLGDYWYNYLVTVDTEENLEKFTLKSSPGLSSSTVTKFDGTNTTTVTNVLGAVGNSLNSTGTLSFSTDTDVVPVIPDGLTMLTSPSGTDGTVIYSLSGFTGDATLSTSTEGGTKTTIHTVAPNANYAPFSTVEVLLPSNATLSGYYTDQKCETEAETVGETLYANGGDAIAAIGPKMESYVKAFMTVQGAVDAATGENTYVTVLQDRTLTDAIVIDAGQNITLDLGGNTLTGKVATVFASATSQKLVTNSGTLRLINGTITFDGAHTSSNFTESNMAATVYNLGTIDYIEDVTLMETASNIYITPLLNGSTGTIHEIRGDTTLKGNDAGDIGTALLNYGDIGTIGSSGGTITITGRRGILTYGGKIETIGGEGSTIILTSNQRGIEVAKSSASIGTIGMSGSTVNITMVSATMGRYAIYASSGPIEVVGGKNSTINITYESCTRYTQGAIVLTKAPNSGSVIVGDENSTITINVMAAVSSTYKDSNYDVRGIDNSTTAVIGAAGSRIYINATQNGSGTATGIYNTGTITSLGAADAHIEIVSNYRGIYNTKTISAMDGVTVISTDETGSYYGLYNGGTITTISGGYFYHGSGARDRAVRNPDSQKYATGYTLSTDTFPVPASDGNVYNCYYLSPEKAAVTTWAANVVLANNLDMMFAFPQSAMTDWTGCYIEAVRTYADGTAAETRYNYEGENKWETVSIGGDDYYVVTYRGFAAKEMCDSISLMVCDSSGNCISTICTDSIQAYALRMLEKATDETNPNEKLQTVIVDMLNYGAACQTHFEYNEENLANAKLSDEQKSFTDPAVTKSTPEGDTWNSSNLITDSNIEFALALNGISAESYVTYSFTGHKGNEECHTVYYKDMGGKETSTPYILIPQLVVADARCTIEVTVCKDGTTTETWYESIEAYVARNATSGDVYYAFMKFADSAKAYLESK